MGAGVTRERFMSIRDGQGIDRYLKAARWSRRAILAGVTMVMTEDMRKLTIVPVAVLLMATEVVD